MPRRSNTRTKHTSTFAHLSLLILPFYPFTTSGREIQVQFGKSKCQGKSCWTSYISQLHGSRTAIFFSRDFRTFESCGHRITLYSRTLEAPSPVLFIKTAISLKVLLFLVDPGAAFSTTKTLTCVVICQCAPLCCCLSVRLFTSRVFL